jgi:hypothetical protein
MLGSLTVSLKINAALAVEAEELVEADLLQRAKFGLW